MKKISSIFLMALALGFSACDNFELPNPPAQTNPQEPVMSSTGIIVTNGTKVMDLEAYGEAQEDVVVGRYTVGEDFAEGYTPSFRLQVSVNEDYANAQNVDVTTDNGVIYASPAAISDAIFESAGSLDNKERPVYLRLLGYATKGDVSVRLGDAETFFAPYSATATPLPAFAIETAYYVIGTASNGQVAGAVKMNHSATNIYDDPSFKVLLNISADQAADGYQWAIIPESVYLSGNLTESYGVSTADMANNKGALVAYTGEPVYNVITKAGGIQLSINMKDLTFEYIDAYDFLYVVGNPSWSPATAPALYTDDYVNYQGFAALDGEYKYTAQRDWDPANWGYAEGDAFSGKLAEKAGNIQGPAATLAWCKVNLEQLTYNNVAISFMGMVGDAVDGDDPWNTDVVFAPVNGNFLIQQAEVKLKDGGSFKFRANGSWDNNWGGEADNLVYNAGNINNVNPAGTYIVTLYLDQIPYGCTITAK